MSTKKYECTARCSEGPCVVTINTSDLPEKCDLRPDSWWKEVVDQLPITNTKTAEDLRLELLVLLCDESRTGMLLIEANKMTDKSLMPCIKSKLDKLRSEIRKINKELSYRERTNPQRVE